VGAGDVALAELTVEDNSALLGRTLGEYGKTEGNRISFVALERPGEKVCIPPRGVEQIRRGDHLIVAGDPLQIAQMKSQATTSAAA
jgi:Trk K+ transport system NAD-binding subunit